MTSCSAGCVPMPAPRPARSSTARSNRSISQPIRPSMCAANSPPTEPPMINALRVAISAPGLAGVTNSDRHASGMTLGSPEQFAAYAAQVRQHAEEAGRDPAGLDFTFDARWYNEQEAERLPDGT